MSMIRKTNPVGIDYAIDKLQVLVYNELAWASHESYGRAYKNRRNGQNIPEWCIDGYDYKELFFTDKVTASSFFIVGDTIEVGEVEGVDVSMIFQANLAELYPTVTHRADEEMHREIALILKNNMYGHELTSIETGIENVYAGLDIEDKYLDDMGDRHVVRFNMKFNFNYNCNF